MWRKTAGYLLLHTNRRRNISHSAAWQDTPTTTKCVKSSSSATLTYTDSLCINNPAISRFNIWFYSPLTAAKLINLSSHSSKSTTVVLPIHYKLHIFDTTPGHFPEHGAVFHSVKCGSFIVFTFFNGSYWLTGLTKACRDSILSRSGLTAAFLLKIVVKVKSPHTTSTPRRVVWAANKQGRSIFTPPSVCTQDVFRPSTVWVIVFTVIMPI